MNTGYPQPPQGPRDREPKSIDNVPIIDLASCFEEKFTASRAMFDSKVAFFERRIFNKMGGEAVAAFKRELFIVINRINEDKSNTIKKLQGGIDFLVKQTHKDQQIEDAKKEIEKSLRAIANASIVLESNILELFLSEWEEKLN